MTTIAICALLLAQHDLRLAAADEPIPVRIADGQNSEPVPVTTIGGTWKDQVATWLFNQAVPTVLLVMILVAIIFGYPRYVVPSIKEGYQTNAESLREVMTMFVASQERENKLIMESHERDRVCNAKSLEMLERAMNMMERNKS